MQHNVYDYAIRSLLIDEKLIFIPQNGRDP